MIDREMLSHYGAQFIRYEKDEYVFYEDDEPRNYTQVMEGSVKMSSYSSNGQEFIQGIFKANQSFGEPAIFGDFSYPNNAITLEKSEVAKLSVDRFYTLLQENFDIHKRFNQVMSHRLRYKAMLLKEISSYYPEHIIMTLLHYLKDNAKEKQEGQFHVPYTRQQIADMTGLRVETVIRTVKKLSKEGKLEIKNHKIYIR